MQENFTAFLLISMPALQDPNFHKSVCLLCSHSNEGAMGIVINRPLSITVSDLLSELEIAQTPHTIGQQHVLNGGPVSTEQGFIIHDSPANWHSSLAITDSLSITTSRDILESFAADQPEFNSLVSLGYSGWGPGQLETEIADNAWLLAPFSSRVVFSTPPHEQWIAAGKEIGVDLNLLPSISGHG